MRLIVAKIGGSLFDLPDLRERLRTWVDSCGHRPILLIPGGGVGADAIRDLDAIHHIGEKQAHWLALRIMTVNAYFLSVLLGVPVVVNLFEPPPNRVAVLDAHAFCIADMCSPGAVGHSWSVTSDTIAARVAAVVGAELVLLKSTDLPDGTNWEDASRQGLVDSAFPGTIAQSGVPVSWVNLRRLGCVPQ